MYISLELLGHDDGNKMEQQYSPKSVILFMAILILLFSNFWGKPTRMVGTAQNLSDAPAARIGAIFSTEGTH